MGGYTRFKRSIKLFTVFSLCFLIITTPLISSAALPLLVPAITAAPLILRIVSSVVMKKVSQKAANDAVYLTLLKGTEQGISRALIKNAATVGSGSVLKNTAGLASWGFVASSIGYTVSKEDIYNTPDTKLIYRPTKTYPDGYSLINIDDKNFLIKETPTNDKPVLVKKSEVVNHHVPKEKNDISVGYGQTIPDTASYYTTGEYVDGNYAYVYGNDKQAVAEYRFNQKLENNTLYCGNKPSNVQCSLTNYRVLETEEDNFVAFYTYPNYNVYGKPTGTSTDYNTLPIQVYKNGNHDDIDYSNLPVLKVVTEDTFKNDMVVLKDRNIPIEDLTDMTTSLLRQASVTDGYDGVDFRYNTTPTDSDIEQAIQEIGVQPTYYDYLDSANVSPEAFRLSEPTSPTVLYVTSATPTTSTGTDTAKDPAKETGTATDSDIAKTEYPEATEPVLEDIPTAEMILAPLKTFFPFLVNMNLGDRAAACPVGKFIFYEKTITIDTHCPLLEENRDLFAILFTIVWGFMATRMILTA